MKLELEVTGGFTGPAGKQRVVVDLDESPAERARELRSRLEEVPESAWGATFLLPHPKSWDFRHVLSVVSGDEKRSVTFHRGAGPAALSEIARLLLET